MHNAKHLRTILGHYASGLTVISAVIDGQPVGFTCQSFHSVSIEPPLVSFNVMHSSSSWPFLRANGSFSINVQSKDQEAVSTALARSGPGKWDTIEWQRTPAGHPLLESCLAWLDCEIFSEHAAGDHSLVLARVVNLPPPEAVSAAPPLIFFRGQYHTVPI